MRVIEVLADAGHLDTIQALALATALGDLDLMWQAIKANLAGVGLALSTSFSIGWMWPEFLTLYIALWLVTLAVLMVVIYLRPPDAFMP